MQPKQIGTRVFGLAHTLARGLLDLSRFDGVALDRQCPRLRFADGDRCRRHITGPDGHIGHCLPRNKSGLLLYLDFTHYLINSYYSFGVGYLL